MLKFQSQGSPLSARSGRELTRVLHLASASFGVCYLVGASLVSGSLGCSPDQGQKPSSLPVATGGSEALGTGGNGSDSGSENGGGDGSGSGGQVQVPSTRGQGVEIVTREVITGTVSVVGSSAAVPRSITSFTGLREADTGEALVRCNYYPNGDDHWPPHVEILAGYSGRDYYQLQTQIFGASDSLVKSITQNEDAQIEDGTQEIVLIAALTHDQEAGAYRYQFDWDRNSHPAYGSTCQVNLSTFDDKKLAGTIECKDLFPVLDSPDYPVTDAPLPVARATVEFDCPLVTLDPHAGIYDAMETGHCGGYADSCIVLNEFSCESSVGCSLGGTCSGSPWECDLFVDGSTCGYQKGCSWDGITTCKGLSSGCYSFVDDMGCYAQLGCSWTPRCDGEPHACSNFVTENTCSLQSGCTWSK